MGVEVDSRMEKDSRLGDRRPKIGYLKVDLLQQIRRIVERQRQSRDKMESKNKVGKTYLLSKWAS